MLSAVYSIVTQARFDPGRLIQQPIRAGSFEQFFRELKSQNLAESAI